MTNELRRFLLDLQGALNDLAQQGDRAEYDRLQQYLLAKGLDGVDLDALVEKRLL